ncbi:MAG: mechanosensitive ion channel domain-containing protein [Pseudomonadota bacterium]
MTEESAAGPLGLIDTVLEWLVPLALLLAATGLVLWLIQRSLPRHSESRLARQMSNVIVVLVAVLILLLVLPFGQDTRGDLLQVYGLVVTAVIALSSTNFASNAMSGLMLRAVGSFTTGDFIRVDQHFGRVTEKSLLHTEIQTEDRDLITLPNLYLVTNPMRVVRRSGTLISCDVSLGYDVHRARVTKLLLQAGEAAELNEPFVQITGLGDFSVGYRVSGFLRDFETMVSKRSELRAKVLDALHEGHVEIVSPNFMAQRPAPSDHPVMPKRYYGRVDDGMSGAEKLMFDKAESAAQLEKLRQRREELADELDRLKSAAPADNDPQGRLRAAEVSSRQAHLDALDELLVEETDPDDD